MIVRLTMVLTLVKAATANVPSVTCDYFEDCDGYDGDDRGNSKNDECPLDHLLPAQVARKGF